MWIIYGVNPVLEALRAGEDIEKVVISEERRDRAVGLVIETAESKKVKVERAPRKEIEGLASTDKHQGVIAFLRGEYRYRDIEELISGWKRSGGPAFFLILDSIQDPQNFGTLVRSAFAAGTHGIIIPKDRAALVTPSVVKASAGATAHTLIARVTNLVTAIERLKEEGVWVIAVEAGCKPCIYEEDLKGNIALVIGSEGKGIRRLVREHSDLCVSIPMAGELNSLNAAQAGTVAMFEVRRQRIC